MEDGADRSGFCYANAMTTWQRLKPTLVKVCESFQLMILGAALLALYLEHTNPADAWLGRNLWPIFLLPFWTLNVLAAWLRPREPADEEVSVVKLAPKWSGIAVVLATGFTAAFAFGIGIGFTGSGRGLVAAAIVAVTILAAVAMWRFASAHEAEIGEARFTSESDG